MLHADRDTLVSTMRRLAIQGGEAIMKLYRREGIAVRKKQDSSPVTEADEAADRLIARGLRAGFPDLPLVTEEQAATHDLSAGTFLIVDPLDGTKEFVQRRGDFTVNIALVEDGSPTLGVVFAPAKGRLFMTLPEGGAIEEAGDLDADRPGDMRPVTVAEPDNAALRVVASKSHRDQATDDYIAKYEVAELVSAGSSLKFCLVATGEADFYPRLGPTMEWDTAAGHAVLAAAGGRVVRKETHVPLAYGKPSFRNPFFLAHAPGVILAAENSG
ncbi:MAG: 3'(2'),5'-bisphosphate nucleotidase CysQ [Boseongicola sp. SB0670_bin_30]|nr:3'(2'),5'-bisphosphate nucleotidase CysQ [Boseongicola sp. SB0670_bin_30]